MENARLSGAAGLAQPTLSSRILGVDQRQCPHRGSQGCSGALSAHPVPSPAPSSQPSHSPAVFLSWVECEVSSTLGFCLPWTVLSGSFGA